VAAIPARDQFRDVLAVLIPRSDRHRQAHRMNRERRRLARKPFVTKTATSDG
jgi:hypothetical protein